MSKRAATRAPASGAPEVRYRPMYARALGLRHLHPGGMLCFVYFEGAVALGLLLALAELVSWWVVLILPVSVALMVKVNDLVAGAVARSAARTPERERERVRREVIAFMPTLAHATITPAGRAGAAVTGPLGSAPAEERSGATAALAEATVQLPIPARRESEDEARRDRQGGVRLGVEDLGLGADGGVRLGADSSVRQDGPDDTRQAREDQGAPDAETTVHLPVVQLPDQGIEPVVPLPDRGIEPMAGGRRDSAGRYAAAGRYLDEVWRQHAYSMAHRVDHADATTQRERQSAARRYE